MKIRPLAWLLWGSLLLLSYTSCGYTRKVTLPRSIKTIHVNTFQNKMILSQIYAYEPGLEMNITDAVIRRFHVDGNLKVVEAEKADAVLEGDLTGIEQDGVRFTGLERVEEYRLYLVVDLRLRERKTGEILWEDENFSGDTSYFVTGPRAVSRGEAVERATDRLARNIVDHVVEDW